MKIERTRNLARTKKLENNVKGIMKESEMVQRLEGVEIKHFAMTVGLGSC